jgi:predicted HNH restriction endonuclease
MPLLRSVDTAAGIAPGWKVLDGTEAQQFSIKLYEQAAALEPPRYREGQKRAASHRYRSRSLRVTAVRSSRGICAACGANYLDLFGNVGLRALEVHHKQPLSERDEEAWVDGRTETSLDEVIVLCATCHRLTHASGLDVDSIAKTWRG